MEGRIVVVAVEVVILYTMGRKGGTAGTQVMEGRVVPQR